MSVSSWSSSEGVIAGFSSAAWVVGVCVGCIGVLRSIDTASRSVVCARSVADVGGMSQSQ
eukprot:14779521-Alexandrium_andersonii.AAC.1